MLLPGNAKGSDRPTRDDRKVRYGGLLDMKYKEADMSTNYATERVSSAIWKHLMNLDVVPPTKESARLATEITEVVWTELEYVGLSKETLEDFFTASNKSRAQGKA